MNISENNIPLEPEFWINEIRQELYVRQKPSKVVQRLIKYYREELKESRKHGIRKQEILDNNDKM